MAGSLLKYDILFLLDVAMLYPHYSIAKYLNSSQVIWLHMQLEWALTHYVHHFKTWL